MCQSGAKRPSSVSNEKARIYSPDQYKNLPKGKAVSAEPFYRTDDEREQARSVAASSGVASPVKEKTSFISDEIEAVKASIRKTEEDKVKKSKGRSSTIRTGANGVTNDANTGYSGLFGG